jgi:transposase
MTHIEKKKINGKTYHYLIKKVWDPKKKNSVKVWQMSLGTAEKIEKGLNPMPKKAKAKYFGDVFSVYDTMIELGIDKIIKSLPLSKKEAMLFQLSLINRATEAKSKNKMESWFKKTTLLKKFSIPPNELKSIDYTRLMKKVTNEHIETALNTLLKNLQNKGVETKDIILDNSNYTTRLQKNKNLTLPQMGKSKNGKKGCLQINIHLVVTRDGKIPIYYKPYQGNINDPTFFAMNRKKLLELEDKFKKDDTKVMLSIDAGHNSEDNIKAVDSKYKFIGTLRPSMCKDLIEKPSSEFSTIINLPYDEHIRIHSEKREIYEKEYLIVVSQFSATQRKSIHTLDDNFTKIINEIKLFEYELNETFKAEEQGLKSRRTKFHETDKIKKHVVNLIQKKKNVKKILTAKIIQENNRVTIEVNLNQTCYKQICDQMGRAIRFTNRTDLTPEEIIDYYRGQYMVEHQFKDFKNPHLISSMPMYHRMDKTIVTFIFTNYLALVILTYMERKIKKQLKMPISKESMLEELKEMKEIIIYFEKKATSIISESINPEIQKKLYKMFNLDRYYSLTI